MTRGTNMAAHRGMEHSEGTREAWAACKRKAGMETQRVGTLDSGSCGTEVWRVTKSATAESGRLKGNSIVVTWRRFKAASRQAHVVVSRCGGACWCNQRQVSLSSEVSSNLEVTQIETGSYLCQQGQAASTAVYW